MFDNSLSGMCLADELRDAFEEDCSFVSRAVVSRKRPSSILSVALAKMDQSTCADVQSEVIECKKTRLSACQDDDEGALDIKEIDDIREHLLELQVRMLFHKEFIL